MVCDRSERARAGEAIDGEPLITVPDVPYLGGADATSGSLEAAANLSLRDAQPRMPDEPSMAPILASSLAFAFVHWDYGPSWVPLFFFALMLGYLYRQTHRLWPSVVAHACLNGLSTLVMLSGGG